MLDRNKAMAEIENRKYLKVAEKVTRKAGTYLKEGLDKAQKVNYRDDKDIKLQADVDSEKMIRKELEKETGFPIIGEELGGEVNLLEQNTPFWVIDPLDGTYNYFRNQRQSCVSVGLMKGNQFLLGIIYDFNSEELYSGIVGEGLSVNEQAVEPRWSDTLNQSCLMTGFPAGRDYSEHALSDFIKHIQHFKKIRMIGSAALALATVAVGHADAYYEESIRLWDIAAGAALVLAAGGFIKMDPASNKDALACNFWAICREDWLPNAKR